MGNYTCSIICSELPDTITVRTIPESEECCVMGKRRYVPEEWLHQKEACIVRMTDEIADLRARCRKAEEGRDEVRELQAKLIDVLWELVGRDAILNNGEVNDSGMYFKRLAEAFVLSKELEPDDE